MHLARINSHFFRRLSAGVCVILLCGLLPATEGLANDDYTALDDYLQQHPEQIERMAKFAQTVSQSAIPLAHKQERPVRIAIVYPALQTSDYWMRSIRAFEARLDELHIEYELQTHLSGLSDAPTLLASQLQQALDWQPDYLVFTLGALIHRQLIEQILVKQTPKLILQNVTTPLRDWSSHPPFLYIGFDHQAGTRLLASHMSGNATVPLRYAMLYHAPGYISRLRGDTFITMTSERTGTELLSSYYTHGDFLQARDAALQVLDRQPELNMLFACSTDIALGAIEALRMRGKLDQVVVNGWGGGAAELEALARGDLDLTVMRMNDDNGVAMAEAIKAELEQRSVQVPQVFSGEMVLVTRDMAPQDLKKLTDRAFRYSASD